jgi:hypothetical protein
MTQTTPKSGPPCQVCGSADPTMSVCAGCADAARRLLQRGAPATPPPAHDRRLGNCSFCGTEVHALRALFVGPDLYGEPVRLCDQCLDLCCDIISERRAEAAASAAAGAAAGAPAGAAAGAAAGAPSTTPSEPTPDPLVTLADGTSLDDLPINQTIEIPAQNAAALKAGLVEKPGRTLLAVPQASAGGDRWLRPKQTTQCPACSQHRPVSSLVACCTTCFARARAPAEVATVPLPVIVPVPAPTLPRPEAGGEFACSFCHRPRSLVRGLVSGPRVFICESCITDFAVALEPHYWWAWERPVHTP